MLAFSTGSYADQRYSPPEASGLSAIKPYPNADDVCQLVRATKNITRFKKKGRKLIACPKHEKGAISDRRKQGAILMGAQKGWVILRVR